MVHVQAVVCVVLCFGTLEWFVPPCGHECVCAGTLCGVMQHEGDLKRKIKIEVLQDKIIELRFRQAASGRLQVCACCADVCVVLCSAWFCCSVVGESRGDICLFMS